MNSCSPQKSHAKNHHANIIGPQIRKLRYARGWSQAKLAVQLQLKGLDMARDALAHIENQTHGVRDRDIPYFASALGVKVCDLFLDSGSNYPQHPKN